MNLTLISSMIFLLSCIFLSVGFYLLKKSEKRLNAVAWIPVTFITWMCYNAYLSAIINLISIPINVKSFSIFNFIIGAFIWYRIIKKREIQSYSISKFDIIAICALIIIAIYIGKVRFTSSLLETYLTSDPSVHFQFAMDIVNNQKVSDMYFAQLSNALIIETLVPIFKLTVTNYYKIFIMSDILMFLLSGMIFYSVISKWMDKRLLKVIGFIITVFYMLAYPLNNLVFGFVYLGLGVSVIAYIIFVVDLYINEDLDKKINIILISFGMLAIFLCYALFMPVVYLATFIALSIYFYKKKDLFTIKTFFRYVIIYLIPVIFGFIYMYLGVFTGGVSPGNAISNEGGIYRDLYSNFIFVIPFALYAFIADIKMRKLDSSSWVFLILGIFIAGFLVIGLKTGKLSSYYYYKNYYFLWLIIMILVFKATCYLYQVKELIIISLMLYIGIAVIGVYNIEDKIKNINPNYVSSIRASQYGDLYAENIFNLRTPRRVVDENKMELMEYVYSNLVEEGQYVPVIASGEDVYWYEAITNQRQKDLLFWERNSENYIDIIEDTEKVHYITVYKSTEPYETNKEYFDSFDKIFENEAGFVIRIK